MVLLTAARALRPLDAQLARDSLLEALRQRSCPPLTRSTSQLEIAQSSGGTTGTDQSNPLATSCSKFWTRIAQDLRKVSQSFDTQSDAGC